MDLAYLLIDLGTLSIPFVFSFHPKINFYKSWKSLFLAIFVTGILFILWDSYFTHLGVWGFNEAYLTGIQIFNLPIEELLFFVCIPYACIFTYHCFDIFWDEICSKSTEKKITFMLIFLLLVAGIVYIENIYTAVTFFSLACTLGIASYFLNIEWLGKFYVVYGVLLLPFLIVNGLLTGFGLDAPIVWYNEMEIIGIRIGTIPVEDVFYGMELILINLLLYKYFTK